MIIDISGSHGTGKTTLIKQLMPILDGSSVEIQSVSRTDHTIKAYKNSKDMDQLRISLQNWANIIQASYAHDYVFCTDLGIRSFAYTLGSDLENCTQFFHEQVVAFFTSPEFQKWYNVAFFFTPVEFPMEVDGFRPEDENYRNDIDSLHKSIISRIPVIQTLSGSPEDRLRTAAAHLISKGAKFNSDLFQSVASIQ